MAWRLIVFAKAPLAGAAKTRLIPRLGAVGAARLARRMLIERLHEARAAGLFEIELCVSPGPEVPIWRELDLPSVTHWSDQGDGDLGERMARAAARALRGAEGVLLVGGDCPALDAARLLEAGEALSRSDAVLIPALDGGYVLMGLRRFDASLFSGLPWGGDQVCALTEARLAALGWHVILQQALPDIDRPEDLALLPDGYAEFKVGAK
ncbi:hypothetical protein BURK2_01072 [Burkholderiales bacterium]|nr:hypothetical protein BURK2_01072 [Burkholderiales bacterium]